MCKFSSQSCGQSHEILAEVSLHKTLEASDLQNLLQKLVKTWSILTSASECGGLRVEKLHWKLNNIHNSKQMCGPIKIMYYGKEKSFRNKMGILITYKEVWPSYWGENIIRREHGVMKMTMVLEEKGRGKIKKDTEELKMQ